MDFGPIRNQGNFFVDTLQIHFFIMPKVLEEMLAMNQSVTTSQIVKYSVLE